MLDKWNKYIGFGFYVVKSPSGAYTVYATQVFYGLTKSVEEPKELGRKEDIVPVAEEVQPQVEIQDVAQPTVEME